jgi:hypothetical protein
MREPGTQEPEFELRESLRWRRAESGTRDWIVALPTGNLARVVVCLKAFTSFLGGHCKTDNFRNFQSFPTFLAGSPLRSIQRYTESFLTPRCSAVTSTETQGSVMK